MTTTPATGFALFPTALGDCGIAWGPKGIVGVHLPEADRQAALARLQRRFPDFAESPMPPEVARAADGVRALLAGEQPDLLDVVLDDTGVPDFHRRVYALARRIPPGQTLTYGEVATALGDKGLARAVGQAMGANPFAPVVPCHRVLAANGRPGGFSAHGGALVKLRMLAIEGARPNGMASLFDV
ncbi:methylated-DNA--[protein]-cysteine S-methyltransferase [soil metagenome]